MPNQIQSITTNSTVTFGDFTPNSWAAVSAFGDFGGGTLTIKEDAPRETAGTALRDVPDAPTLTAEGGFRFLFTGAGGLIYATLAGATSPDMHVRCGTITNN